MRFKCKLSQRRRALISAALAASAALALACDRADLTRPEPLPSPMAQVTPLPVPAVVASADDGNVPQNTLDNNLATRWSAFGDGQWIQYDLGADKFVGRVDIAWYQPAPNTWESAFDIDVSPEAGPWTRVFSGRSSAGNAQPQGYGFPTVTGRYVRITGHGQWDGATLDSWWNSITEVDIYTVLPVSSVLASGHQDPNVPGNTLDNNLGTRWSQQGDGSWIRYDLGSARAIGGVDIAWYQQPPDTWESAFDIEVSSDAATWTRVFSGRSSAGNVQYQRYEFSTITCRYVRIVGHGQWDGATFSSWWNSITEVDIHPGSGTGTCPAQPPPVASVSVSPATASVAVGKIIQLTATLKDANGNVLTGRTVTWSSSNDAVAATSVSGQVLGKAAGSVTITATSEGKSGTAAVSVTAPPPSGTAYYVATTGNDAVTCTQATNIGTPKRTLNNAVTCLTPGSTLLIRGGTYLEALYVNIPSGSSWANPVTLKSYPGEVVILKPTGGRVITFGALRGVPQQYIVIDGLVLDGANTTPNISVVKITWDGGTSDADNAHHIRIQNSEIKNGPGTSNGIGADGYGNELINNDIHDNGLTPSDPPTNSWCGYGVYWTAESSLIKGNRVHHNGGWGFHIYSAYGGVNNNVIDGNRVYDNAVSCNRGVGLGVYTGTGNIVRNNLVYGNRFEGISGYGISNTKIYNNTVFGNGGRGISIDGVNISGTIVKNNIAYQNRGGDIVNAIADTELSNNLTGTDPKFVNSAAFDFHLQSISPAINRGVALPEVAKDFDGKSRPQGTAYDIGAYEY
jgi:parallel beta-helix repeat protein